MNSAAVSSNVVIKLPIHGKKEEKTLLQQLKVGQLFLKAWEGGSMYYNDAF